MKEHLIFYVTFNSSLKDTRQVITVYDYAIRHFQFLIKGYGLDTNEHADMLWLRFQFLIKGYETMETKDKVKLALFQFLIKGYKREFKRNKKLKGKRLSIPH